MRKNEAERIEMEDEGEEDYEVEGSYDESDEPPKSELPPLPPRPKHPRRKEKYQDEPKESKTGKLTVSEYFDVIEGNLRRAYLALEELRKLASL